MSGGGGASARTAPRGGRRPLLPALLALVGCALAYRLVHDRSTRHHDPLHGNMEAAQAALSGVLDKTPAADRLPLLLNYARDPSPGLRYAALDQLGDDKDPRVADAFEAAFRDSDSEIRKLALHQLPRVDFRRGLHQLLCGLRDDDTWMRENAIIEIKTLAKHRPPLVDAKVVPNLIAALDDPDDAVVQTTTNLLRTLTGHNWYALHRDPPAKRKAAIAHWKTWWSGVRANWPTAPEYASAVSCPPTRTDPCPEFSVSTLDGHLITSRNRDRHITLLNFWSYQAAPCQLDIPTLVAIDHRYRARQVDLIGIQIGLTGASEAREVNALRDWCQAQGVTYPQALVTPALQEAFGDIHDVPVTLLIDRRNRIRYRWEGGPREPEVFAAAIEHLLQEGSL